MTILRLKPEATRVTTGSHERNYWQISAFGASGMPSVAPRGTPSMERRDTSTVFGDDEPTTMHELTGLDVMSIQIDELIADGPTRVVVVATNSGTDVHGAPWKMTVLELVDVVDGKIAKKRSFYQDTARLRDISLERERTLADAGNQDAEDVPTP